MEWKTPITIKLYDEFGNDYLCLNLYIHLLIRARNTDMSKEDYYEGKPFRLKRGQSLFGRKQFAKYCGCSESAIFHALERLEKRTSKVTCTRSKNYTIVTIKSYDKEIEMSKQKVKQQTSDAISKEHLQDSKDRKEISTNVLTQGDEKEYGNPEVNQAMRELGSLLGSKPSREQKNRQAAYNLIRSKGLGRLLKAIKFAFSVRDDQYAPSVTSYIDLQGKWEQLETYSRRKKPRLEVMASGAKPIGPTDHY